jgi:hypothetical protein|tara:strand:+ start:951 stop:1277 length:327 start_codon:yes stop_codon:yes gene_type:complete
MPVAGLKWNAAPVPSLTTALRPGVDAGLAGWRMDCAPGVLGPHERRMDGDPGMGGGTRAGVTAGAGPDEMPGCETVVVWYSVVCCAPGAGAAAGAGGGMDPSGCIGSV